jgi:hypothetical protein
MFANCCFGEIRLIADEEEHQNSLKEEFKDCMYKYYSK